MFSRPRLPIRVLIAGPRALVRAGLAALLHDQPQIELAGAVAEIPSTATSLTGVDVLLLDPGDTRARAFPVPCLVLLARSEDAPAWLAAGSAMSVILETSSQHELLDALRQTVRGEPYFPRALTDAVAARTAVAAPALVEPLTDREREVVALLAQGLSNKDIAQKLYLSVRTVEGHLANIYGKLQVRSRTEAVVWAIQNT